MLRAAGLMIVLQLLACGDRSPPALWPEAPPPTLAAPLGIAEPSTADAAATDGDAAAAPVDEAGVAVSPSEGATPSGDAPVAPESKADAKANAEAEAASAPSVRPTQPRAEPVAGPR